MRFDCPHCDTGALKWSQTDPGWLACCYCHPVDGAPAAEIVASLVANDHDPQETGALGPLHPPRLADQVYVISADGGPVKIGLTGDPKARRASLQTGSPIPLHIRYVAHVGEGVATIVETQTHALLAAHRLMGEWFDVTPAAAIAAVAEAVDFVRLR